MTLTRLRYGSSGYSLRTVADRRSICATHLGVEERNTDPGILDEARGADEGFLENYLPFLLHRSYQLLSETFHAGLADVGLDITECRIINSLADFGPLTLQRIQVLAYIVQPTASRACTRLESRGLLTRRVGAGDKRQRIFELTEDGWGVSRRLMEVSSMALAETLVRTSLDPRRLKTILKQLIADLERSRPGYSGNSHGGLEQP